MCGMSMSTEVGNYQRLEQLMNGIGEMPDITLEVNGNPYDIEQEIENLSNTHRPEKNSLPDDYLLTVCHIEDENSPQSSSYSQYLVTNDFQSNSLSDIGLVIMTSLIWIIIIVVLFANMQNNKDEEE